MHSLTRLFAHSLSSSWDSGGSRPAIRLPNKPDLVTLCCHFSSAKQLCLAWWPVASGQWLVAGVRPPTGSGVLNCSVWTAWLRSYSACRQRSGICVRVSRGSSHVCRFLLSELHLALMSCTPLCLSTVSVTTSEYKFHPQFASVRCKHLFETQFHSRLRCLQWYRHSFCLSKVSGSYD